VITTPDPLRFFASLRTVFLDAVGIPRVAAADLERVGRFAFEVVQNTRDHGAEHLYGEPIDGVRMLLVRNLPLSHVAAPAKTPNPLSDYCAELAAADGGWVSPPTAVVELTVADCGVGIPARLARTIDIYGASLSDEREELMRALRLRGTSKPATLVGAGYGLFSAIEATRRLRGMILIRAGRLGVYRNYLTSTAPDETLAFSDWTDEPLPTVAGTAVSLIFPAFESGQGSLEF
jgi:hypothetical protein